MCMLILNQSGVACKQVIAFTGDMSEFPELDMPEVAVVQKNVEKAKRSGPKKPPVIKSLTPEKIIENMLFGACDELAVYQGSTSREAIRKQADTTCRADIQRGHLYMTKSDPHVKPKGRRAQNDTHKDRRLTIKGSSLTRVTTPTHSIPPAIVALYYSRLI